MSETPAMDSASAPNRTAPDPGYAYVNGSFCALHEAAVPLLDWGFNKSDVVYDGIPFTEGLIFRLEDHLDRFWESMAKWRLPAPEDRARIADICHDLVVRSELRAGIIYLCTTRGIPPSATVRDPAKFQSRLYAWTQEIPDIGGALDSCLKMIISSVPRIPESSVDASAKNFHWGDLIQARLEAGDRGAQNALLLGQDGKLAEGVGFNVFIAIDGALYTPGRDCLRGITRRTVVEIAEKLGIPVSVGDITVEQIKRAQEILITSSAGGIFGVSPLDGQTIGDGTPGPLTRQIRAEYWRWRELPEYTTAVAYDRLRCE
jgi:branched-chain amino acid aminotransferase